MKDEVVTKNYLDQALERLAKFLDQVSRDSKARDEDLAVMTKKGFDQVAEQFVILERKVDNIMLFEIGQLKKDANITNQRLNYLEQAVGMSGK